MAIARSPALWLAGQDDGTYMLGEETFQPRDAAAFSGWRFGSAGRPHPATCAACGRKTDPAFVDDRFRVRQRRRDITATYDGYTLVSTRFVEATVAQGWDPANFVPLPGDPGYCWLNPTLRIPFEAATMEDFCSACQGYGSVVGPGLGASLPGGGVPPNVFASTVAFGSVPLEGPVIGVTPAAAEALRKTKLKGVELSWFTYAA